MKTVTLVVILTVIFLAAMGICIYENQIQIAQQARHPYRGIINDSLWDQCITTVSDNGTGLSYYTVSQPGDATCYSVLNAALNWDYHHSFWVDANGIRHWDPSGFARKVGI